ncbi:MAG: BatA domain-containing protein [Nitrospinales bacterium]
MNLNFISPAYLLGLLGISLPILVHLLTRRRQTRIKFSAVYLLFQSEKRSIKRSRPNRLLLLLFRCLAIICLSLALANPIFSLGPSDEFLSPVASANVFILDDSYSMGKRAENKTVYAEALKTLANTLKNISPDSSFSLVSASAPGRVLLDWVRDREMLFNKLKLAQPSHRTTDIGHAVSEAQKLLETASQQTKRIFILTDRDKNGWDVKSFPKQADDSIAVKVMDFSGRQKGKNRAAVTQVAMTQEFLTDSRIIRLKASVANLLPKSALRGVPLTLWINGKKESEVLLDLPPGSVVDNEFSFPLPGNESVEGFVEIADDALAADNRRYFTYQPDRKINVLVVDGDPNMVAHQSETFYLERALNPFYGSFSDIKPTISTLDELSTRNLRLYSVIMLCNVRALPIQYELELEEFVMRGGALIISLGDKVDPKFYNEKMGNLLPVNLESLNRPSREDKPFHFLTEPSDHPVLKPFKGRIRKEMSGIRFFALYKVSPRTGRSPNIPMRFKNGLPAVVEFSFGKGKTILFVSSIDRDWNDFPIQPTFLPWVQRWVKYSARSLGSIVRQDVLVGRSFVLDEEMSDAGSFYLETLDGRVRLVEKDAGEKAFPPSYRPGVYRVYRSSVPAATGPGAAGKPSPKKNVRLPVDSEKIGGFAVNVDTRESNAEKISNEEIRKILSGLGAVTITDYAAQKSKLEMETKGTPLTTPFLLLMALALFWEGWQVRRE